VVCTHIRFSSATELGEKKGGKVNLTLKTKKEERTYNTRDSLVVTDPTTDPAVAGLSMGERTGSRISQRLWSYVTGWVGGVVDVGNEPLVTGGGQTVDCL
jgi:hypothetical protein